MSESLKDKVAVISGVGSGFSKATAELFAQKDKCSLVMLTLMKKVLKKQHKTVRRQAPG